jgi:excisionase family DNA binding protein
MTATVDPVLEAEEIAAILKVHPEWVRRKARAREIPAFKVGKFWRMRESTLQRWMAEQEQGQ